MAVTLGTTLQGYNKIIENLVHIEKKASKQGATGNLRFNITRLVMFANDYIITEKDDYLRMFARQLAVVEEHQNILRKYDLSREELALVDSINADLDSIVAYANRIFAIPQPRYSPEAAELMVIMDYTFGDAVYRKTTQIFDIVSRSIERHKSLSTRTKEQVMYIIYAVFFAGLLLSFVIMYLSVQKIAKPIRTLAKAADAIANGDYSQRPVVSTRDEIGKLARSFSQMAEAIEKSYQELELLSTAIEKTNDSVMITDQSGIIQYVNTAFENLTGFSAEEVLGKKPSILKSGKHSQEFYENLWQTILAGKHFLQRMINRKKNGELYHIEKTITPLKDDYGNITHFVDISKDITEIVREAEQRHKEQERHKRVIENIFKFIPERVLVFSDKMKLFSQNKMFEDIVRTYSTKLGYAEEELKEIIIEEVKKRLAGENNSTIKIEKKNVRIKPPGYTDK